MALENRYFLLSGFLAFFLYFLFIILLLLNYHNKKNIRYNSISKDTVIELDIIVDKKKDIKKVVTSIPIKKEQQAVSKKIKSSSAKQKTNLKSLFAKVSIKGVKIEEKTVSNVRGNEVVSRFKSKFTQKKKIKKINLSKIVDIKQNDLSVKKIKTNNKGNFNKYYSKIHAILLNRWYKYPLFYSSGYLAKVKVTILPNGIFKYNIIKLSNIDEVDIAVKKFLDNESKKLYPKPFDKKTKEFIINFKPEKGDIDDA